jgi:type VI secretion system FHA domain protein
MILTLEVTGAQAGALGPASRKVFDATGGTIGRLASNAWVLQHPYVSSRHALIRYADGVFTIEDTRSANGIFINSLENRLPPGERYPLKQGDVIFIDPFEIRASIARAAQETARPARIDDPFALDDVFGSAGSPAGQPGAAPHRAGVPPAREPHTGEEVDPLNLLGFADSGPAEAAPPRAADLAGGSALSDHFRPPPPAPEPPAHAGLIPDDYNPLLGDDQPVSPPAPGPAPPPARPAARAGGSAAVPLPDTGAHARPGRARSTTAGGKRPRPDPDIPRQETPHPPAPERHARAVRPADGTSEDAAARAAGAVDLAAVLAGAGVDPSAVTPELARSFGQILRVVVSGLMDVLQARQRIKDEFGMRMTTFRPADNNPLKFSANVEDALHNLLVKRNAAYLGPVDAFEDAFADVRNHQMAMLAGVRVAFESMLAEFDPVRLQEGFDRQLKKGSILTVPAKLRYWDLYRERFGDMVKDAEASFADLFGDEFARAYEEQLERLKARRRPDTR